jgi:ABC-type Mn2+/Zn2+ transport system permease subunit
VDFLHLLLLTLLSLTIVISIKVVGIILVSAYLIISGATAILLTQSFKKMIWISTGVGIVSSFLGLWLSNTFELPSGAVIVLVMLLFFLSALSFNYIKTKIANIRL